MHCSLINLLSKIFPLYKEPSKTGLSIVFWFLKESSALSTKFKYFLRSMNFQCMLRLQRAKCFINLLHSPFLHYYLLLLQLCVCPHLAYNSDTTIIWRCTTFHINCLAELCCCPVHVADHCPYAHLCYVLFFLQCGAIQLVSCFRVTVGQQIKSYSVKTMMPLLLIDLKAASKYCMTVKVLNK